VLPADEVAQGRNDVMQTNDFKTLARLEYDAPRLARWPQSLYSQSTACRYIT